MSFWYWLAVALPVSAAATYRLCRPGRLRWAVVFIGALIGLPLTAALFDFGELITPFRVLKTASVVAASLVVAWIRWSGRIGPRLRYTLWGLFAFNIFQAAAVETSSGNWMNPLAGMLLIAGISSPRHCDADGARVDWDLG